MAAKQKLFDGLGNKMFKINIFRGYIDFLIQINLESLNLEGKKDKYKKLIQNYLNEEIKDPDIILNKLEQ